MGKGIGFTKETKLISFETKLIEKTPIPRKTKKY